MSCRLNHALQLFLCASLLSLPAHALVKATLGFLQAAEPASSNAGSSEHEGAAGSEPQSSHGDSSEHRVAAGSAPKLPALADLPVQLQEVWPPKFPRVLLPPGTSTGIQADDVKEVRKIPAKKKKPQTHAMSPSVASAASKDDEEPNLTYNMFDRFIVLPEYNLLFCYIEKNACTAFNDLFSQLRKRFDPKIKRTHGPEGWFQLSPYTLGYTKAQLEAIMTNKSWHKAVFYRDPIERFVSAYRSKCEHFDVFDGNYSCYQAFGHDYETFTDATSTLFSWRDFTQKDEFVNAHFKRQSSFCGGLDRSLQYYDIVEELKESTAREKTLDLLHKIGADKDGLEDIEDFDVLFPPPKAQLMEEDNHTTNTVDHLKEYFPSTHPEALAEVFIYYEEDYRLFNISKPQWEQDQLARVVAKARNNDAKHYWEEEKNEEEAFDNMDKREKEQRDHVVQTVNPR